MQYRVSGRRERISGSGAADRTLQKFKSPSGGGDHGQMRSGKKNPSEGNCSLSQEGKWKKKYLMVHVHVIKTVLMHIIIIISTTTEL